MKLKIITSTLIAIAVAASAGFTTAADGEATGKPKQKSDRPGGPPPKVIAKYDKDGDGKLNQTERAEARKNRRPRAGGEAKSGEGKDRPDDDNPSEANPSKTKPDKAKPSETKSDDDTERASDRVADLFKRADKNADGKLTEDEVSAQAWVRLSKADKNNDGSVTIEELQAAGKNRRGAGRQGGGADGDWMTRMDKNGDGNLSKDELSERAWSLMSHADKDGDGVLSKQELATLRAQRGSRRGGSGGRAGGDMFTNLDKNKDGKLTEDEVPAHLWARLSKADKDADGAISKSEMEALRAASGGRTGQRDADDDGTPKRPKIEP